MQGRKSRLLWAAGVAAVAVVAVVASAIATDGGGKARGQLEGYQEVPAVSTKATGSFSARIVENGTAIAYTLRYSGLEGSATAAHIHLGQKGVNGGVAAFFCSNPPTSSTGPQRCPTPAGTVSGTIRAANVIGPTGQGIAPGEFGELIRALHRGVTYANVHSAKFPSGEIRLQLRQGRRGHR